MRTGADRSARLGGLYVVHQNVPGKRTRDLSFPEPILFFPLRGEIEVTTATGVHKLGPGRMLFLPGGVVHSLRSSEAEGERLIALMDPKLWRPYAKLAREATYLALSPLLRELLFHLLLEPEAALRTTLVRAFAGTLAESLARAHSGGDIEAVGARAADGRLRKAIAFLAERFADEAPLEGAAKRAGLSPRSFHRLSVTELGLAPKELLIRFRVAKAREMLATGASVTDVAFAVGYRSLSAFIAAFRSRTGHLPSARS